MNSVRRLETITLPVSLTAKEKLLSNGYLTIADLEHTTVQQLTRNVGLTVQEAVALLRKDQKIANPLSAAELFSSERRDCRIITFSSDLDEALGGGVRLGRVTELCGVPGIGKTQIALQLCVDVTIPSELKGVDGAAVYIDTDAGFAFERVEDMSRGLLRHLQDVTRHSLNSTVAQKCRDLTVEKILNRIHLFRVTDCEQQIALMKKLPSFIDANRDVRLVVFDSIAFHFRYGFNSKGFGDRGFKDKRPKNMGLRTRLLSSLAQEMMSLAETRNISIVYTNQVRHKVYDNSEADLVEALGGSWSQCASTRVRFYYKGNQRVAFLHKASDRPKKEVPFDITRDGIRTATRNDY